MAIQITPRRWQLEPDERKTLKKAFNEAPTTQFLANKLNVDRDILIRVNDKGTCYDVTYQKIKSLFADNKQVA